MKKLFSSGYSANGISFALLILRLGFGGLMIQHGLQKLNKFNDLSSHFMSFLGLGQSISLALVIFAELFCAGLLVAGLLTRVASIPLIIVMSVAFFKGHNGIIYGERGGEMALLFLTAYIAILFAGPGKFSADKLIGK